MYNIIEVNENSLFASLFPLVWFLHYKLYLPLFLIVLLFILLGSVEWWLFLSSWIILTIYMNKGSMSILRAYCLFNEMRVHSKIYTVNSESIKDVQLTIRQIDNKSHNFLYISFNRSTSYRRKQMIWLHSLDNFLETIIQKNYL